MGMAAVAVEIKLQASQGVKVSEYPGCQCFMQRPKPSFEKWPKVCSSEPRTENLVDSIFVSNLMGQIVLSGSIETEQQALDPLTRGRDRWAP